MKPFPLEKPLVIVGMPGVGKSVLGRKLAKYYDTPFFDSDKEVEKGYDMSIPDLFEQFGEREFRKSEATIITKLLAQSPVIISSGGGAFIQPDLFLLIKQQAVSLWMDAERALLWERIKGKTHRPLFLRAEDPETCLKELYEKRNPVYEKADITLKVQDEPVDILCEKATGVIHNFAEEKNHG